MPLDNKHTILYYFLSIFSLRLKYTYQYMYTLGAGRIFIKSFIIVCFLDLMAWKASWAHRTGENEGEKKDNDKIKSRSKRRAPVV